MGHLLMDCVFVVVQILQSSLTRFIFLFTHLPGSSWAGRVKHGEILSWWRGGRFYWLTFCRTRSHSRQHLLLISDSLSLVGWKKKNVFPFFQEASTQERGWEGDGPRGELPAKIPAGERPVPESRVPDPLPAARTGTWCAGAKRWKLLKFQEYMECCSCRVTICNLVDNLLSIICSHCSVRVPVNIKDSFLVLLN